MVTLGNGQDASPKGHIAIYASNDRRGSAIARAVEAAGHSSQKANTPADVRRLLDHQRFDVGTWVVRDDVEASDLGEALEGTKLPMHTVVVGSASTLPQIKRRRGGSLRLVSSNLTAAEIAKVAGASIGQGTWEEPVTDDDANHREPVVLESIIESAASAVYKRAKRKQQRFSTVVSSASGQILGRRTQLSRIFTALLRIVVDIAPVGASIATTANENASEWQITVAASHGDAARRPIATTASELQDEEEALQAVSQEIRDQGGILWVDLAGPEALSLCFTLPLPAEALQHA
ncbi:MAG: hypothetical protein J4O04_07940 [Chloroflexi bacterium]|nr:hypothetical protein [Chloroflexota bacterium]